MYEIIKNILLLILGIGITILGFYMIYLKKIVGYTKNPKEFIGCMP